MTFSKSVPVSKMHHAKQLNLLTSSAGNLANAVSGFVSMEEVDDGPGG